MVFSVPIFVFVLIQHGLILVKQNSSHHISALALENDFKFKLKVQRILT